MDCWEFMRCGREHSGNRVAELGVCPAFPGSGRTCARVAGTFCEGKVQGTFALKLANCLRCNYYNSMHYDREYAGTS